jgi:hypothetical protein
VNLSSHFTADRGEPLYVDGALLRQLVLVGILSAAFFALFSYGGIRSPDGEVQFRTAEALATRGTFAVRSRVPRLKDFGLPAGTDGRYYSLFGPAQPIACVPLIDAARCINRTGWYNPVSQKGDPGKP